MKFTTIDHWDWTEKCRGRQRQDLEDATFNFSFGHIVVLVIGITLLAASMYTFAAPTQTGYGVVGSTASVSDTAEVISYDALSVEDKTAFRSSTAYSEQRTVFDPSPVLSDAVASVDYISLDDQYYAIETVEYPPYDQVILSELMIIVGLGLVALGGDRILKVALLKFYQVAPTQKLTPAVLSLVFILLVLSASIGMFVLSDQSALPHEATATLSEDASDSEVTPFEELSVKEQYLFTTAVDATVSSEGLRAYEGEYIQTDGELYYIEYTIDTERMVMSWGIIVACVLVLGVGGILSNRKLYLLAHYADEYGVEA